MTCMVAQDGVDGVCPTSTLLVPAQLPGKTVLRLTFRVWGSAEVPGDVCDYDTSDCSMVPAGGTCQATHTTPTWIVLKFAASCSKALSGSRLQLDCTI